MGIHAGGCIYVGKDGKRRQIDLSAAAASPDGFRSLMDSLSQGGATRPRRNAPVVPPLPMPGSAARNEKPRESQPMPGSAIVDTRNGLALRGEENNPLVEGKKVYGSVDGRKGYHTLDQIDPDVGGGRRVGPPQTTDDEDESNDSMDGFNGEGMTVPSLTRLHFSQIGRVCTLKQYESERKFSPGRRLAGASPEISRVVATWLAGGEEEGVTPHPFDIEQDENSEQLKIVRAVFYYGGEERTVEDTYITPTGSVWLLMEKDEEDEDAEPTFSITQNEPEGDAKAIRLYDFDGEGNVSVDYRHALVNFGGEEGVTSLNEMDGDIEIVSDEEPFAVGEGKSLWIKVDTEDGDDGKKIVLSLTDKDPKDEDESDEPERRNPCTHPESDDNGGVRAKREGGVGWSYGSEGIPEEIGIGHPGNPCNCE